MQVSSHTPLAHGLEVVIDFVNTLDVETEVDQLTSPAAVADWLLSHELADSLPRLRARDLDHALALREALRAAMLAHNDGGPNPVALAELERAAERGQLSVHFGADGAVTLEPRAQGLAAALARLLVPVAEAAGDGTWERVKACRADDCQWAFYDHSRNRSARWCDMAVCGNRTKVRTYRRKRGSN